MDVKTKTQISTVYTIKQIKDYLKKLPEIKFHDLEKEDLKLSVFLENILIYCKNYDTVTLNNTIQTKRGTRRTVGDLYRITKYYFPRIGLTTVYKSLLKLCAEKTAVSAICQATGTRVYRYDKGNGYFNSEATDEFYTNLTQFEEFKNCKSIKDNWGYDYTSSKIKYITIK